MTNQPRYNTSSLDFICQTDPILFKITEMKINVLENGRNDVCIQV